jgi:hypothetical protein
MPLMDIQSGVITVVVLLVVSVVITMRSGLRTIQLARKMTFYRLRRQREAGGWRLIGIAFFMLMIAILLPVYGLPIAYEYFPPSPTPSMTPTITPVSTKTLIPTVTLTPTITDTPLVTDTATITTTPSLPLAVLALFQSSVTPDPGAVFSPLTFSTHIDNNLLPIDPATVFQNPITEIFATYNYRNMIPGVQWTAVWKRDGQEVCLETHPFRGVTGGYDSASCKDPSGGWQPGIYELQIFVGEDWKAIGRFLVQGNAPTVIPTFTKIPTYTLAPSLTPTQSKTLLPSATPTITLTLKPSATITTTKSTLKIKGTATP